jgi:putative DNA primase/helicase
MIDAALAYAKTGFKIFPCHNPIDGRCSCGDAHEHDARAGKHPRIANWPNVATTDREKIREWWTEWPDANVGVPTGKVNGITVVDIDPRNGGDEAWAKHLRRHQSMPLPPGVLFVETGAGGSHIYFEHVEGAETSHSVIGPGIDVQSDGAYVIGVGSLHVSGNRYKAVLGGGPRPAPEWLVELIRNGGRRGKHHGGRRNKHGRTPTEQIQYLLGTIEDGSGRDDALISIAGMMWQDGVAEDRLRPLLEAWAAGHLGTAKEATDFKRIVKSAKKYERDPDRHIEIENVDEYLRGKLERAEARETGVDPFTDQWLGLGFVSRHVDEVRYTAAWSRYNFWDGNLWRSDDTLKVFSMAQLLCREVAAGVKKGKDTANLRNYLLSGTARARMLEMARENPEMAARPGDWDRDPWLLGTPSGTVDLRTGELRPSDPRDMISLSTAVAPGGDCTLWKETLKGIFLDDEAVISFVKRLAGYSLTGLTVEEILVFLHGGGGNGKGTVVETILYVIGDYGCTVPMTTLIQRRHQEHPTEIAKLHRKRLAVASETEEGARWNTARIKLLTGSDRLTGRFMRNDYFDFDPTFQLFVSANEQPSFGKVDDAIRRRLVMIPFLASFCREDDSLDEKRKVRLKAESPGVLRWLIDGCLEWQAGGLNVPRKLRTAADDYLAEANDVARFVNECCIVGPRERSSIRELYAAFCTWCADKNIPVISQKALTIRLQSRGLQYAEGHARQGYFSGIRKALETDLGVM